MTGWLLLVAFGALATSALAGAVRPQRRGGTVLAIVGATALTAGGLALLAGGRLSVQSQIGPAPFALTLERQPLSGLMLLLIGVMGILAFSYADGYLRPLPVANRAWVLAFTPLFVASMAGVVLAGDVATFLIAWEAMSLTSFALVVTDGRRRDVLRSGYIYLVMTHAGAVCLAAGFLLLANATGSMDFATWAHAAPALPVALRSTIFLLVLLGFGSKAALVPLHVWLPRAHPVAPSHVSGLMSGVMLKVAIYGLVLVTLTLLGPGPLWWGLVVLGLGVASAVLGVLYALMEHDLKRLLAYHSVENIGIITIGLGVALIGESRHLPILALVALVAALYHTINHSLFKTALFFGAGSIQHSGAGRNLDRMGGLLPRLPWTAASILVCAAAISGLPPLNGFISEWLTYQSLVGLATRGGPLLALCGFLGILGLALTGGLAAACFVKVSGVGLLGRPRSPHAGQAREVAASMFVPTAILAVLCLAFGLLPGVVVDQLVRVAAPTLHLPHALARSSLPATAADLPWAGLRLSPLLFAIAGSAAALVVTAALAWDRSGRPQPRTDLPWACGGQLGVASQYSATVYAKPFRQVFALLYRPVRSVQVETAVHPFFRTQIAYEGNTTAIFDRYLYAPAVDILLLLARQARRLQSGSLRLYLGYILVTLVLLLAFVR